MTRVLVVDDDVQLTRALKGVLERERYETLIAGDAESALEELATSGADLVVLDLRLPDKDGLDVVRRLRTWSDIPVLVLSAVTDQHRRVEALDAGADDFLQKPFGVDELLARLRAIARRAAESGAENKDKVRRFGDLSIDLASHVLLVAGDEVRLTPTEWRLLEVLIAHPGRLLTHRWILEEVWDRHHGDESKASLRAHVRGLRAKLRDDASVPRYVRTDSGLGYRWIATESEDLDTRPDEEQNRIKGLDVSDLVHELGNAVTAMRIAVRLLSGADASSAVDPALLRERLEEVTARVSLLSTEVQQRLGATAGVD